MKRKLVMQIGADYDAPNDIPEQYTVVKQHWLCQVHSENPAGLVDEYEILPDRKLLISDFLEIVKDEIGKLEVEEAVNWAIKVYRLTGRN